MKTQWDYLRYIWIYEKRREQYKKEGKPYRSITEKICTWRRTVRRIEKRYAEIKRLHKLVKEFTQVDIKASKDPKTPKGRAAKGIYFKYGLENGMIGTELGQYVNITGKWTPTRVRKRFTASFKTNEFNRNLYHSFIQYVKHHADK